MGWILNIIYFVQALVFSYFYGALPFGRKITFWVKGIDILAIGSGNQGAANVYRVAGIGWAFVVFVFDASKGALPIVISNYVNSHQLAFQLIEIQIIVLAMMAIMGHSKSIFIPGFQGGKGVATLAGVLLALEPRMMAIGLAIYAIVLFATRYSSLGSLLGGLGALGYATFLVVNHEFSITYYVFVSIAVALIFYLHKKNIPKILDGTENKLFKKRFIW